MKIIIEKNEKNARRIEYTKLLISFNFIFGYIEIIDGDEEFAEFSADADTSSKIALISECVKNWDYNYLNNEKLGILSSSLSTLNNNKFLLSLTCKFHITDDLYNSIQNFIYKKLRNYTQEYDDFIDGYMYITRIYLAPNDNMFMKMNEFDFDWEWQIDLEEIDWTLLPTKAITYEDLYRRHRTGSRLLLVANFFDNIYSVYEVIKINTPDYTDTNFKMATFKSLKDGRTVQRGFELKTSDMDEVAGYELI